MPDALLTERTLTDIGSLPMQSTKIYECSKRKIAPLFLAGKVPLCSAPPPLSQGGMGEAHPPCGRRPQGP